MAIPSQSCTTLSQSQSANSGRKRDRETYMGVFSSLSLRTGYPVPQSPSLLFVIWLSCIVHTTGDMGTWWPALVGSHWLSLATKRTMPSTHTRSASQGRLHRYQMEWADGWDDGMASIDSLLSRKSKVLRQARNRESRTFRLTCGRWPYWRPNSHRPLPSYKSSLSPFRPISTCPHSHT